MTNRHAVVPRTMSFIFNKDKVLLYKASNKKEWEGKYDTVGGHIEKGENILDAANREIQEETGLVLKNTKLKGIVHVSGFYGKEIMLFVTTSSTPNEKVISSDEGKLEWIELKKIDEIDTFEDLKPIIKKVLSLQNNEMFIGTSKWDGKDGLESISL